MKFLQKVSGKSVLWKKSIYEFQIFSACSKHLLISVFHMHFEVALYGTACASYWMLERNTYIIIGKYERRHSTNSPSGRQSSCVFRQSIGRHGLLILFFQLHLLIAPLNEFGWMPLSDRALLLMTFSWSLKIFFICIYPLLSMVSCYM